MTVQTLTDYALVHIDEAGGTFDLAKLPLVTQIVSDLMRQKIGINSSFLRVNLSDYTSDYTVDDYVPVRLPVAVEDQIINVQLEGFSDMKMYTETNGSYLYLLVPEAYSGVVLIEWMAAVQTFTAMSDVLPLSDAACISVASLGVAALLSLSEAEELFNVLEGKYQEAIARWKRRPLNKLRRVRASYNMESEYGYS